jgi:hypothetical protein
MMIKNGTEIFILGTMFQQEMKPQMKEIDENIFCGTLVVAFLIFHLPMIMIRILPHQ